MHIDICMYIKFCVLYILAINFITLYNDYSSSTYIYVTLHHLFNLTIMNLK